MDPTSLLSAVNAYKNQMQMARQASDAAPMQEEANQTSFADLVGNAIKEATEIQRKASSIEMQAMVGKVDLADLVTAVSSAELTLNTVVAVRDRVINAYQDIMRMAI